MVISDTRGPRFESSHRQKIINIEHLYTVNCVLKRRNKEKEAGIGPFFLKKLRSYSIDIPMYQEVPVQVVKIVFKVTKFSDGRHFGKNFKKSLGNY